MLMDNLMGTQSIIVALDVDSFIFKKLKQIAQAGFSIVEINCVESSILKKIRHDFPMLRIGAGSVVTTQQLDDCIQSDVHFITSPGFLPAISQTAAVNGINYIPGVATISEAMTAMNLGCQYVRPFPATIEFCAHLNKYLPSLHLFPAEIKQDEMVNYLNVPSVAMASIINPKIEQLNAISAHFMSSAEKLGTI